MDNNQITADSPNGTQQEVSPLCSDEKSSVVNAPKTEQEDQQEESTTREETKEDANLQNLTPEKDKEIVDGGDNEMASGIPASVNSDPEKTSNSENDIPPIKPKTENQSEQKVKSEPDQNGEEGFLRPATATEIPRPSAVNVKDEAPSNIANNDDEDEEVHNDRLLDELMQDSEELSLAISATLANANASLLNGVLLPTAIEDEAMVVATPAEEPEAPKEPLKVDGKTTPEEGEINEDSAPPTLPPDFFDDMLDKPKEQKSIPKKEEVGEDVEKKYAEVLRKLQQLEDDDETSDKHKKKHKKKSRKRDHGSRSRSRSPKRDRSNSQSSEHKRKRSKRSPSRSDSSTPSKSGEPSQASASEVRPSVPLLRVKAEFNTNFAASDSPSLRGDVFNGLTVEYPQPSSVTNFIGGNVPSSIRRVKLEKPAETNTGLSDEPFDQEMPEFLTPKEKKDLAIRKATAALSLLQKFNENEKKIFSTFLHSSTVRKLPSNSSYVTKQFYENRSPLHTVNNVTFEFNSFATRINLHEWGLEAVSRRSARIIKALGYDAQVLAEKLKTQKLPPKLQKIKREIQNRNDDDVGAEVVHSSLYANAGTQTDDMVKLVRGKREQCETAVQATPKQSSIGTQTNLTTPTARYAAGAANDNLPLMQLLGVLNENQLLALNDFAELLREPATSAMDIYQLRQRMLDIYKCAQMPPSQPLNSTPTPHLFPAVSSLDPRTSSSRRAYFNDVEPPHQQPVLPNRQSPYPPIPPHLIPPLIPHASAPTRAYPPPHGYMEPGPISPAHNSEPPKKGYGRGSSLHR